MKKIFCYLLTIKELDVFLQAWFNFGALYINHDYYEVSDKYIKTRGRIEHKLRCKRCGDISIAWKKL